MNSKKFENENNFLLESIKVKDNVVKLQGEHILYMENLIEDLNIELSKSKDVITDYLNTISILNNNIINNQLLINSLIEQNRVLKNNILYRISKRISLFKVLLRPNLLIIYLRNLIKINRYCYLIKNSNLFDKEYYLNNNPDVANSVIDPIKHFILHGGKEKRNPSSHFDTSFYLKTHPDVSASNMNPLIHYILHGEKEKRKIKE